jgi:hypothetical protein
VGGLQNIGSGALAWLSAMMPQTGQASLGLLMTLMGLLILLCWLPLASRVRITSSLFNRMMARLFAGLFTTGAIIACNNGSGAGRQAPSSPS